MTSIARTRVADRDPLGETLHLLRLTGTLYCQAQLSAPWGIAVPPMPGSLGFVVVMSGQCWLQVEGSEPLHLEQGSLSLIPHGTAHRFASDLGVAAEPLFDLPVTPVSERFETMQHGGGGEPTLAMYGVVQFDHAAATRLVAQLPPVISVNSWVDDENWLHSTVRFIAREAAALRPGGETVITRLADVLVIQAIRSWLDSSPAAHIGWLAALRDEHLGRALSELHRDPAAPWSVAALAQRAGMSRSAFSARFTEVVGESAMRYLTHWRLSLAHSHLQHSTEPLAAIAEQFGYASEVAFSRAFKREFAVTPGRVRTGRV